MATLDALNQEEYPLEISLKVAAKQAKVIVCSKYVGVQNCNDKNHCQPAFYVGTVLLSKAHHTM